MRDIAMDDESFDVVHAPELGGWVVIHPISLKVVEPGYLWPTHERAVAWARGELDRLRLEALEYQRRQAAVVEQGLAGPRASQQSDR